MLVSLKTMFFSALLQLLQLLQLMLRVIIINTSVKPGIERTNYCNILIPMSYLRHPETWGVELYLAQVIVNP